MVTLGIPDDAADELVVMSGTGSRPLRESAQWVPDVPADSLCLNEGIFIGAEREEQEYQPLYYILFGGPEGSYRKNLIRIGVWMSEFGLYGIEFEYNTEIDGRRIHTLGRCGPLTEKTNNGLENADDNAMESFDVDGPHGETIKTVKVEPSDNIKGIEVGARRQFLCACRPYAYVVGFQFGTNRGRKKLISTNWGAPLLPLAIAPTSSITGIYVAIVRVRICSCQVASKLIISLSIRARPFHLST